MLLVQDDSWLRYVVAELLADDVIEKPLDVSRLFACLEQAIVG